jgi:hypothetical protein
LTFQARFCLKLSTKSGEKEYMKKIPTAKLKKKEKKKKKKKKKKILNHSLLKQKKKKESESLKSKQQKISV